MALSIEAKGAGTTPFERQEALSASVLSLPERINALSEREQELVARLFEISIEDDKGNGRSHLVIPPAMRSFVIRTFGNGKPEDETIRNVEDQRVIVVQDRYLKSEAVYNPLRRKRPQPTKEENIFQRDIDDPAQKKGCPFCSPEDNTPSDSQIGRLTRGIAVTASNMTKFAREHTLVLGAHNPYEMQESEFTDQMQLLLEWANKKAALNPSDRFARFGLNRGYKAAGSKVHDHYQGEMRAGSMHFPYAERLNEIAYYYSALRKGDFLADLLEAHKALGLAAEFGQVKAMSMLVPPKEHGIMLIDNAPSDFRKFSMSDDFIKVLWEVQQFMLSEEKVREYNIFILPAPKDPDCLEYWRNYRTVAIFVDRGHSINPNADWGYAELSGTAVISYDPFDFAPRLNSFFQNKQRELKD